MNMAYSLLTQSGGLIKVKAPSPVGNFGSQEYPNSWSTNRGGVGLGNGEAFNSGSCIDEIGR